jgi:hypothetical protein
MRKKFDKNSNRNNEDLKFGTLIDDYDFIICETLTHRRPI